MLLKMMNQVTLLEVRIDQRGIVIFAGVVW